MSRTTPTFYPEIGDKVTLRGCSGNCWTSMVRDPYTVVGVSKNQVLIQECKLNFNGPRYYDTIADSIEENPNGRILTLTFINRKGYRNKWVHKYDSYDTCPRIADFGYWEHQPYLD